MEPAITIQAIPTAGHQVNEMACRVNARIIFQQLASSTSPWSISMIRFKNRINSPGRKVGVSVIEEAAKAVRQGIQWLFGTESP
jgi:hypothetical protein